MIFGDVPMGASVAAAAAAIRLIVILNDVSFRNLIPGELAKGFGFLQGKARPRSHRSRLRRTNSAPRGTARSCRCRCCHGSTARRSAGPMPAPT